MCLSKKIVVGVIACCYVIFGGLSYSYAQRPLFGYITGKLGYNQQYLTKIKIELEGQIPEYFGGTNTSSMGFGGAIGLGYTIIPKLGVRGEVEYIYRLSAKTGSFQSNPIIGNIRIESQKQTILGNMYLDYYVVPKMNVYAGFGLGATIASGMEITEIGVIGAIKLKNKTTFTWQVGVGAGYALTENIILDANVRYVDYGRQKHTIELDKNEYSFSGVEALVGVTYRF